MFRTIVLLSAFGVCASSGSGPIREITSPAERVGNSLSPAVSKGYIYWVGRDGGDGQVTIYAPDGRVALAFDGNGRVRGVAFDTDGGVAVAWGRRDSAEAGGIDFRDRNGQLARTIRTPNYLPAHLAFAEDHTLWTFGSPRNSKGRPDPEGMTVRKFLPDGKQAGAYLPRSAFPAGLEPAAAGWQWSNTIVVARDRVGLWAISGQRGDDTEWVELDLNGNLLGRWRLDQFHGASDEHIALTADGHVFIQYREPEAQDPRVFALDRASSTWQPVEAPPSGWMEGADGNALIFSDFALGPIHLRWVEHP